MQEGRKADERALTSNIRRKALALRKRRRKYIILLVAELLAGIAALAVAVIFFYVRGKYTVMNEQPEDISFVKEDITHNEDVDIDFDELEEKYWLIMAYGVDARNNSDILKDANADTDIIVCINRETYEVKLVSVLRDSYLCTTSGKYRKLTDIYAGYGVKESMETINKNFDLNSTQYVTVNWKAVGTAIDLLGGVDIEVTNAEIKQLNSYGYEVGQITGYGFTSLSSGEGVRHLNGTQAVGYARIRNVTIDGEGHDIARATRQRKVINAMLQAAKEASLGDLNNILSDVLPLMATNISFSEALSVLPNISKYSIVDQGCFPFHYIDQENLTTAYVYYNTLASNVTELHEFLFGTVDYSPSGTVRNISAYIDDYRREHP